MINISDHLPSNFIKQRGIPSTSTSRVRATSPSPHPSIGTVDTESTSRSSNSAKISGERLLLSKDLALNVRIIRGRDYNCRGTASRGRLGRSGEERGTEIQQNSTKVTGSELLSTSSDSRFGSSSDTNIQPLDDEDRQTILRISHSIKQQLDQGWKIEDSGPISRGWGD
ncbi:hypothetical protein Clacol_000604 [Clathrus columnatus]|uniref:Uncharacterized protein n=1 Tax=Clathrus columnatus TaxID=1419009 RepID=A0AAV4ZZQ5_9AGAM|nr:hypothetical protein Clacol_000604 [Clathrus columnatus]